MKKWIIEAVFDDKDFGVIGPERSFFTRNSALKQWNKMELSRRKFKPSGWHYRVRNTKTDETYPKDNNV